MNWKLWLTSKIALAPAQQGRSRQGSSRQGRPRDLPQAVGRHLVVDKGCDPDWVWSLKCVRKSQGDSKSLYDIRIFNPLDAAQNHLAIKDYTSLDDHMDLVLMSGTYDKNHEKASLDYIKMPNAD